MADNEGVYQKLKGGTG